MADKEEKGCQGAKKVRKSSDMTVIRDQVIKGRPVLRLGDLEIEGLGFDEVIVPEHGCGGFIPRVRLGTGGNEEFSEDEESFEESLLDQN